MKSRYIVVEGLDCSGKTTAINTIFKILTDSGIFSTICVHEPGGTILSEKLTNILKYGIKNEKITDKAELLIFYALRAQLLDLVIKPAIKKGIWVVSDRCDFSTYAYQGGGRKIDINLIKILSKNILNNFKPDLVLYLDVDLQTSLNRIKNRGKIDRIEKEEINFFRRTREKYLELSLENDNVIKIDANQSLINVQKNINTVLMNWLALNDK